MPEQEGRGATTAFRMRRVDVPEFSTKVLDHQGVEATAQLLHALDFESLRTATESWDDLTTETQESYYLRAEQLIWSYMRGRSDAARDIANVDAD